MVSLAPTLNKPAVSGPRQQAWIRALDRARLVATRKPCYLPRFDAYRVYSERSDRDYRVSPVEIDGTLSYDCECEAGRTGKVCWHAALVAALPYECSRRAAHREQQRAARAAAQPARSAHDLLMECYQ